MAIQADVARLADLDTLYTEVSKKLGKIDVLFAKVGIAKNVPLAETSEIVFDEQFDINIKGAYFTIQKALPYLERRGFNHLEHERCGQQRYAAYAATKAALRSLARTAAAELAGRGMCVNTVAPGPIASTTRKCCKECNWREPPVI